MILDNDATKNAAQGWEIWRTSRIFQAIKIGATPESKDAWGPQRTDANEAIADAERLSQLYVEDKRTG